MAVRIPARRFGCTWAIRAGTGTATLSSSRRRTSPTRWRSDRTALAILETPAITARGLRLTERFTRTSENTMDYTATVDDPQTWTKPWPLLIVLTRSSDAALYEYACHEGTTQ